MEKDGEHPLVRRKGKHARNKNPHQYGIPLVQVKKNGKCENRIRDYSTLGRAMRAIREIVRCADFE